MGAPFGSDEPSYNWKYPDPPPYEGKLEVSDETKSMIVLCVVIIGFTSLFLGLSSSNDARLITDLKNMSCHEFTLRNDFFPGIVHVGDEYMKKCHPDLFGGHIPTEPDVRIYFSKLTCDELATHIKYKDFWVQDAVIESLLRCS